MRIDRQQAFSGTTASDIDATALEAYLAQHIDGFAGPLTLARFKGGQSNPTYKLTTPHRSYVLRRKPLGKLLPSAHAIDLSLLRGRTRRPPNWTAPMPLSKPC